jgi:hypothetical protein
MVQIFPRDPLFFGLRGLLCTLTLALGACASLPPPTLELDQARAALQSIEGPEVERFAPVELRFARDSQQQAQQALLTRDYALALSSAERTIVYSDLAAAKSQSAQIRTEADELEQVKSSLQQQVETFEMPEASVTLPPSTMPSGMTEPTAAPDPTEAPVEPNPNDGFITPTPNVPKDEQHD